MRYYLYEYLGPKSKPLLKINLFHLASFTLITLSVIFNSFDLIPSKCITPFTPCTPITLYQSVSTSITSGTPFRCNTSFVIDVTRDVLHLKGVPDVTRDVIDVTRDVIDVRDVSTSFTPITSL
jgi:hypothetical protein